MVQKYNNGQTALQIASCYAGKEIVELLISRGININEKDKNGETALHIAVQYNRKEIAEFLISHGININEKDKNGETCLLYTSPSPRDLSTSRMPSSA